MAKAQQKQKKQKKQTQQNPLDKLNAVLYLYRGRILLVSVILTVLFSFLLFNFNVSLMGDDGAYIKRAYRLLHHGDFPGFQGPVYPFVLSFFIWIFGLNITFLKALSGIFILGHLYFFYRAFQNRVPSLLFVFTIVILATNAYLLSYSSLTFSEALFLFIQAFLFFYLFRYIWEASFKNEWQRLVRFLVLGAIMLLLAKTRSIGYGAVVAVVLFMAVNRNWKNMAYTLGSFGVFYFVFKGIKAVFFGISGQQFSNQLDRLLLVNPYDPSEGKEDLVGFIERFWGNSELYLSKHIYKFLGLRPDVLQTSTVLTILTYALFILALVYVTARTTGKLLGGWLAARYAAWPLEVPAGIGRGLISQSGVAVAMTMDLYLSGCLLGEILVAMLISAFILNELISPAMARPLLWGRKAGGP